MADYIARDFLNFAIRNKDNHIRNTAILKRGRDIALAPAFDVAPMVLDPEGFAREEIIKALDHGEIELGEAIKRMRLEWTGLNQTLFLSTTCPPNY
ncbi:HipA domain-containing protein [uncultured Marinobacter sp.]|uniref:HipA domain-containing protein n=1 Tax=uncultured Marinobacter sp. TaxID=187379 RepID=UPI002607D31D|nr:HipA domain-containing protein [uncultured Marinobacter sp.]